MTSEKNIVGCDWRFFPDTIRAGVQWATVDDEGNFCKECSPLFFCKGLIFAGCIKRLSYGFDEGLYDTILVTCSRDVPIPFEITAKFLCETVL